MHKIATENILASQERYKKQYDKTAKSCIYPEGKILWLYSPTQLKAGTSKKMQIKYNRLVRIKEKVGDTTYIVVDNNTGEELKYPVHVDNLREYTPELTAQQDAKENSKIKHDNSQPKAKLDAEQKSAITQKRITVTKNSQCDSQNKNVSRGYSKDSKLDPTLPDKDVGKGKTLLIKPPTTKVNSPSQWENTTKIRRTGDKGNEDWLEPESLVKSKVQSGNKYYLVEWCDKKYAPTWESSDNIPDKMTSYFDAHFWPMGRKKREKSDVK